jgi:hypothetical protein
MTVYVNMAKADLHNHIRTPSDIYDGDFNRVIDRAAKSLGHPGTAGAIMGVVNFEDARYEDFIGSPGYGRQYLGENRNGAYVMEKKVLVVKGQEVPTKQGHLLVMGTGSGVHLTGDRNIEYTIKEARDCGGIIILDHPFFWGGAGKYVEENSKLLENIDAMEIHNGEALWGNRSAREFYDMVKRDYPNLGAISTSDGHSINEIGSSWIYMDFPDIERAQDFVPSLRESVMNCHMGMSMKMKKSIVGALAHAWDLLFIEKKHPGS